MIKGVLFRNRTHMRFIHLPNDDVSLLRTVGLTWQVRPGDFVRKHCAIFAKFKRCVH